MPPASAAQGIIPNLDRGLGFSLLLGTDYEKRKQKLQQELQLDYKQYVAKKKDPNPRELHPQIQGLSLPIDEKISAKEKLREERKKEYNLFLQEKTQIRRLKRGTPPVTSKPGQVQASDAVRIFSPASHLPILNTHTNIPPPSRECPASRRDAATLTDAVDNGKSTGTWEPGYRGRRRWQICRPKEPYTSEEELFTDKEEELEFRHRRRKHRHTPEPVYKEERRIREHRTNRAPLDIKEVEAPGVHDQNNNDWLWKSDLQTDSMRMAARSRPASSKDKAEFATGLLIGATEEQTASRLRKEQYMQELQKQMAEQQRNKMREKRLELRVAATGATDPEKEPDRLKQFGAVNRQYDSWIRDVPYKLRIDLQAIGKDPNPRPKDNKPTEDTEQRDLLGNSQVDYSTALSQLAGNTVPGSVTGAAQGVPSLDYFNEDYHRNFSNMLGEVAIPRVAGVPPPIPPTVTNNYKTPYDAPYYYYGTRNPLDPNLPHYQDDLPGRVQQSGNIQSSPQKPPPLGPSRCIDLSASRATDQYRASPLDIGEFPVDKSKQRKESALSYQEALRQQIKERAERKRKEKEEKERYDAKVEAEMKAYNPWGRSGGGAPIKDQNGNLFHDLNQRNKINKESCRNPVFKNSEQTQNVLMRNGDTPGVDASTPISPQLSGLNDQTTQQQLPMQDRYREALEQQIEENKRKQAEERERMRIEEENEERRLAEQRVRIQREYEEEQKKKKRVEHRLENQSWINEPKTHRHNEEKKRRQEQETEKRLPEVTRDREEKRTQLSYEREPSPPIPALQKKRTNLVASSPPSPSVVSQFSSRTERTVSAPHYQPVPEEIPQLQDGQQEVIRELSALRRYLRKEQRQLEVQLGQTDQQESHYTPPQQWGLPPLLRPRRRPRVDAFEPAHQADQPSTARIYSDAAGVNMQNIREFNQLKYRDTSSREEVLQMYPDPPTDAQSLDIQQQALLREQRRKIRLMKREEEEHDFLDQQLSHYNPRNKPGHFIHRDSMLPSETAFIDVYSGDACEERVDQQRSPQPSAQHRERTVPRRRHDDDISVDQREHETQTYAQSLPSSTSLNDEAKVRTHNQRRITRQDSHTGEHNSKSERLSGDERDVSSLHSALERRVSVETVATEPWLRPGTSASVKRSARRERPNRGMDAPPWLTDCVT